MKPAGIPWRCFGAVRQRMEGRDSDNDLFPKEGDIVKICRFRVKAGAERAGSHSILYHIAQFLHVALLKPQTDIRVPGRETGEDLGGHLRTSQWGDTDTNLYGRSSRELTDGLKRLLLCGKNASGCFQINPPCRSRDQLFLSRRKRSMPSSCSRLDRKTLRVG